ncbi:tape measure protein [Gallaecimonas xiamenensis]|uniref:Phage tape measure protein n=1 Tax=Gallaecimonas xiamenensis 3-C-1 TaxID=745411 RepID=K2JY33_9GAMM|nr:tape measure protein [Gallaecimonas xiamenensis]EKE75184.1 phage tape measure protein [Gallaecimonas xiamenensis 3-C-1]
MKDLTLSLKLTADGRQLVATVNNADQVVEALGATAQKTNARATALGTGLDKTASGARNAATGIGNLDDRAETAGSELGKLTRVAAGLWAAFEGARGISDIVGEVAAFQDIRTRLESLSGSAAAYADNQQYLIELSREQHKELTPLADSYARLLTLQQAGLVTQSQARSLTEGISNAQSALGASTEQVGQAMYGLSQALASPIVRAEDLNQVVEPLPGLLNQLDKAAGLPAGGFRKLMLAGQVTSEFFRDTLIKALGTFDGAAAATGNNINALYRDISNAYTQAAVAFETPINDTLKPVLHTIADALLYVSDNAEEASNIIETVLAVALARGAVAAGAATVRLVEKAVASRAAAVADLAEAKAEMTLAEGYAAASAAGLARAGAEERLAAARANLAAATARANVATAAMTTARTLGTRALALVGGWPGLILGAVAAWATFDSSAQTAAVSVDLVDDRVRQLKSSISGLGSVDIGTATRPAQSEMEGYLAKVAAANAAIVELRKKQASVASQPSFGPRGESAQMGQLNAIDRQIATLEEKRDEALTKVREIQAALNNVFNEGINALEWNGVDNGPQYSTEAATKAQALITKLQQQVALYGDVSNVAKLRYEMEKGELKNLDPALQKQLLTQAKLLDQKDADKAATKAASDAQKEYQRNIDQLLNKLDPYNQSQKQMAENEKLLKTYFEQANVPLKERQRLLAALQQQGGAYESLRRQLDPAYAEKQNNSENLSLLNNELDNTPASDVSKRQQINALIEAEQRRHSQAMTDINRQTASDYDLMWSQSFDRFASGIGQAVGEGVIYSNSMGDAAKNVINSVGSQLISTLVEIGIKKVASIYLTQTASEAATAAQVATGTAAAATLATSWATAAAMTSLASFGGNAVPATAGIASTTAFAEGLSVAGIFHSGGTVPREGTYLLDGGETVYTRAQHARLMQSINNSSTSNSSSTTIRQENNFHLGGGDNSTSVQDQVRRMLPEIANVTTAAVVDSYNQRGDMYRAING